MIIRLLQRFSHMELAPDAQPPDSLPPTDWAKGYGRRSVEKIFVKSHLTAYVKVCALLQCFWNLNFGSLRGGYGYA